MADAKNPYLMLDSTIVRAHQQAATGRKKRAKTRRVPEVDSAQTSTGLGKPVAFRLTVGQASQFPEALPLLAGRKAEVVLADRGYDSTTIVHAIQTMGAVAVIPSKICRTQPRPRDRELYKLRNRIECCFSRIKHFRRLATRYRHRRICFQASVALAWSRLHLAKYVDTA